MKIEQTIKIKGVECHFWMIKTAQDDIDIMVRMDGHEPIKLLRLRPDGKIGLYKIAETNYPFDVDSEGYILVR